MSNETTNYVAIGCAIGESATAERRMQMASGEAKVLVG